MTRSADGSLNRSRRITVSQAVDVFLSVVGSELKPATFSYYEQCLRPLRGLEKGIERVGIEELRAVYAELRNRRARYESHPSRPILIGGLSIYTLHKHVRAWRRFFRWLLEEGMIKHDPSAKLRRPRLPDEPPKDVSLGDLMKMLEATRDVPRDHAIICFLADTACRVGGLVNLRMTDLDLENGFALVHEKGERVRPVYFKPRTAQALSAYLATRESASGDASHSASQEFVFVGTRGRLTTAGIYQILRRVARRAGVMGRSNPHAFRHAWARQALKRGANLKEVSDIMGHSSIVVTAQFYARYLDQELQARHGEVSWLPERNGKAG